jgi:toxin ParE1/3/4
MPRPVITKPARADLKEIVRFVRERSPQGAWSVRDALLKAIDRIGETPGIGHGREDLGDPGFRCWPVGSYLIVYEVGPVRPIILRVLHGARDVGRLLG